LVFSGLGSRGLVAENPESTGDGETIWFVNPSSPSQFIGVRFIDEEDLVLYELAGDSGPFALGHTLVILYTHPLN
jgi:hypothetical protein